MLDETLRKLLAEQEPARRLTDQLEMIRRQTEPLSTTLAMLHRQSTMHQLAEEMNRYQEIVRTTLGPLAEELHRTGAFASAALISDERSLLQQAIDDYEARFRLPEMSEATRLITQIQSTVPTAFLCSRQEQTTALQHAIEAMRSPWLDSENALHSISAFAELQGIGQALRSLAPFDIRLANALRPELGDWRQTIEWPAHIFTDPIARTEFYIDLGLNTALTDFPAPAFNEGLSIAGLREALVTKDSDEQQGFARTNAAHNRLQRFETQLRRFINERMTAEFGPDWIKHQVPGDILKAWMDKKQKAIDNGEQGWPLIAYADFTDGSATQVMLATRFRATVGQKQTRKQGDQQQLCSSEMRAQHVAQASTRKMAIPAMGSRIISVKRANASLVPRPTTASFRMSGAS